MKGGGAPEIKDPIQLFLDFFNEYSMPLIDQFFNRINKVPLTTLLWVYLVWMFALTVFLAIAEGILK